MILKNHILWSIKFGQEFQCKRSPCFRKSGFKIFKKNEKYLLLSRRQIHMNEFGPASEGNRQAKAFINKIVKIPCSLEFLFEQNRNLFEKRRRWGKKSMGIIMMTAVVVLLKWSGKISRLIPNPIQQPQCNPQVREQLFPYLEEVCDYLLTTECSVPLLAHLYQHWKTV